MRSATDAARRGVWRVAPAAPVESHGAARGHGRCEAAPGGDFPRVKSPEAQKCLNYRGRQVDGLL